MKDIEKRGPKAPKDPIKKRPYFFVMQGKGIYGSPQADGRGVQFIYANDGRVIDAARLAGNLTDEEMLDNLRSTKGFRKMVHSIGVSVSSGNDTENVRFVIQMYPENPGEASTEISLLFEADGMERIIELSKVDWKDTDKEIGQFRFEFEKTGIQGSADVRFYLNDGFEAPEQPMENAVDFESQEYKDMISRSLMQAGNTARLEKLIEKAAMGEDVTLGFIGGSITQGAGAIPIHQKCYPRIFADAFKEKFAKGGNVDLVKAGVGGTPSELGMIRFERDILRDGQKKPDLIVIEFAVNDEGDETKGVCYESLVRKALDLPWKPAVVLLFAVFSYDWNLQDRLSPVGIRYNLPMVSIMDAVTPQFPLMPEQGRVISKNQFFYDQYHPSNLGHKVMCDSLIHLIDEVNKGSVDADFAGTEPDIDNIKPVLGKDFEKVTLLDRKELPLLKKEFEIEGVDAGSFSEIDKDIQRVEMDSEIEPVPEFPYNCCHVKGSGNKPFKMSLKCSKLLIVFKDSGLPDHGTAQISVDGEKVMELDPLQVGWTHCNPVIVFNDEVSKKHDIEVKMIDGHEDKKFTILGFGVVK
ncbi:MAG: SGNH/GDSL hydrolase family protein [Butyrivibrio sp.]|nr:SGNH/GDSL hydrolase family protein [Butyrivibrio sp.]